MHVVATPIGNARDITLRALDTLRFADVITCEDTRVTAKLLSIHGIRTPMLAYHEHNAERMRPRIIERLKNGETVALVSDAGTPLVSDPGYKLVRECIETGLPVTGAPGPSSLMAALVLSGLPSDRFLFAGFPPPRTTARRKALGALASIPATLVFLESAKRLASSLADMAGVFGPRPAAVARELTKKFEEVRRENLDVLAAHYAEAGPPKGEVVVVVGPPEEGADEPSEDELEAVLRAALDGGESVRDATARIAAQTGVAKRQVYALAVSIGQKGGN
ncbi:MAG: 16S rRNA (cytidine(1402)-2'-O)-methyltransferase [Rhodospirillales bacterium]|nr:16S rRNA (cytidine(1402)-2'-O)-methyltransferase [Rhodospirillales bacterium]